MSAEVIVVLGPARAGKTHELVGRYHDALTNAPPDRPGGNLWLAPSSRAAAAVRDELIDRGTTACLGPGVLTFDELAKQIVAASNFKTRPISPVLERELIRRVITAARSASEPSPSRRGQVAQDSPWRGEGALKFFAEAAGRAGFVDLLAEHFRELKRRDIHPTAYKRITASRGQSPQQRELARLYTDYEQLRTTHALADEEGLHLTAREALDSGACSRFANLELVVVDGFNDFTRTQLEIIRLLAARSQRLCISLPTDATLPPLRTGRLSDQSAPGSRTDLFAKTTATLAELKQYYPNLKTQHVAPLPAANPALDYLAQHVFRYPQPTPPANVLESLNAIEIVETAGTQDEIIQLARRIKAQLTEKGTGPFSPRLWEASPTPKNLEKWNTASASERPPTNNLSPFPAPGEGSPNAPTNPSDIVVVFRSVTEIAPRIEAIFNSFGIPYSLESSPRLARSAVFKTLTGLLQLNEDDWPFRRVVSIVTNNTLTALTDSARQAADWLVRDLQIAAGSRELLEAVGSLAAQQENVDQFSDHHGRRVVAAATALPALTQLSKALARLPQKATPNEWCAALERLGADLGLSPFAGWHALRLSEGRGGPGETPRPSQTQGMPPDELVDAAAWNGIVAHFAAIERLDAWLGTPPKKLNRSELISLLVEVATHEALSRPYDDVGRVRILSAQSARAVPARHLYLAGMSEQSFPSPVRSGQLATDAEYRFLTTAAHQTKQPDSSDDASAPTRAQDEMLLFYEVLSRAQETLTISYPAMDSKAQELPPSPYVVELQRMFRNSEKQISRTKPQLSPVPQSRSAEPRRTAVVGTSECRSARGTYSITDWRIAALAEATQTDGDRRLLAGLLSHNETKNLAQAIDAGVRIIHARARGEAFGPSEGLLMSPAVAAKLNQRFGGQHSWSPSQLETYAACPYKFYLQSVLKLEPLGDLVLETDFARRGSLVHQVLAAFHRKLSESPGSELAELWRDEARFDAELKKELQAAISATPREGIEGALLELDRRQIHKWTDLYHGQHQKYDGAWSELDEPPRPAHFELRFGRKHRGEGSEEDSHSTDDAYVLDIGGESINVSGRIDRIDVGRAGDKAVFNVIDYKSGRRPTLTNDKIESGERLQPALYVMAAEALVFGPDNATPLWAGYWSMQGGVTTDKRYSLHCSVEGWETLRAKVIERIGKIVRATRKGEFPVDSRDPHCTSLCDFKTVCRIAQVRSVGKVWEPGDA